MSKGGGGGPQTSESTNVTTNLPEYARPFYEEMLGRTTYESTRPYETYQGTRIADFNPTETAAMTGMTEMAAAGAPQQIRSASDIATQIGYQPTNMGTNIAGGFNPQQQFSNYKADELAQGYTADSRSSAFNPTQSTSGYAASDIDPGYIARELGQDYTARDLQSQYTGQGDYGPGFQAGSVANQATIQDYMNPYQQLVTDVEKQKALEASGAQAVGIQDQATQSGGLGGYREAIMQSERQKNLSEQLQNIQSTGSAAAFNQAQQAFEADRAARLQEAQLGLQTGTAGQQAQQQAEQLRQSAFGTTEQARQAQQKMAVGSFQAGEQARQQAAKFGMSAQQQEEASRQAQEKLRQGAFGQTQQGMAQQEQFSQKAFDAGQQANQAAQRFQSDAFQQNQRAQQAQNEAAMRARAFNVGSGQDRAKLGLAGLQADQAGRGQSLDAARLLSSLGGQEQAMAYDRLRNMQASGEIQRGMNQRSADMGYQDFLRQQAFPREQIGFFSNMLQGLPVTPGSTMASYGVNPSTSQQVLGAGIGGVGLYNALGRG